MLILLDEEHLVLFGILNHLLLRMLLVQHEVLSATSRQRSLVAVGVGVTATAVGLLHGEHQG